MEPNHVVETILKENVVCYQREILNRARNEYRCYYSQISQSLKELKKLGIIDYKEAGGIYSTPIKFYYIRNTDKTTRNNILDKKLKMLIQHSKLTEELGAFGQDLIARILRINGYQEVETNKKKHKGIGINRKELDVWGKHPCGYYQHIEVKNRTQEVSSNDVLSVKDKSEHASECWKLPIKSAIACCYINSIALKKANSENIPVLIAREQHVPIKHVGFYQKYRNVFCANYLRIVDPQSPPDNLLMKFKKFILHYDYC